MTGLLSILLGILGSLGILSAVGKFIFDAVVRRTQTQVEKIQAYDEQEQIKYLRTIIKDELQPVREDVSDIRSNIAEVKEQLALDKEATIVQLRTTMKSKRDEFCSQGYVESSDKSNWIELYNRYRDMGGNHFAEYVDGWKQDIENLPVKNKFKKGE